MRGLGNNNLGNEVGIAWAKSQEVILRQLVGGVDSQLKLAEEVHKYQLDLKHGQVLPHAVTGTEREGHV